MTTNGWPLGRLQLRDVPLKALEPLCKPPLARLPLAEQQQRLEAIRAVDPVAVATLLCSAILARDDGDELLQSIGAIDLPEPEPEPEPVGGRPCAICDRLFNGRRGAATCSPDCQALHRAIRAHRPPQVGANDGRENRCEVCGTTFLSRRRRSTCSPDCFATRQRQLYQRRRQSRSVPSHPLPAAQARRA